MVCRAHQHEQLCLDGLQRSSQITQHFKVLYNEAFRKIFVRPSCSWDISQTQWKGFVHLEAWRAWTDETHNSVWLIKAVAINISLLHWEKNTTDIFIFYCCWKVLPIWGCGSLTSFIFLQIGSICNGFFSVFIFAKCRTSAKDLYRAWHVAGVQFVSCSDHTRNTAKHEKFTALATLHLGSRCIAPATERYWYACNADKPIQSLAITTLVHFLANSTQYLWLHLIFGRHFYVVSIC